MVILKFKGIDDRNDVERMRQAKLLVTRENAVELGKDEYFIADLIGIQVVSDEGEELGTISDVLQTGANDVYVVSKTAQRSAHSGNPCVYPERGCGCGTDGSTSAAGTALNGGWTMKFHVLTLFPDMVMQGL